MKDLNKLVLDILQKKELTGIIKTFTFPESSLQTTQDKWESYYTEQQINIRIEDQSGEPPRYLDVTMGKIL